VADGGRLAEEWRTLFKLRPTPEAMSDGVQFPYPLHQPTSTIYQKGFSREIICVILNEVKNLDYFVFYLRFFVALLLRMTKLKTAIFSFVGGLTPIFVFYL